MKPLFYLPLTILFIINVKNVRGLQMCRGTGDDTNSVTIPPAFHELKVLNQ